MAADVTRSVVCLYVCHTDVPCQTILLLGCDQVTWTIYISVGTNHISETSHHMLSQQHLRGYISTLTPS